MVIDLLSPGIRKSGTLATISQLSEQKSDWILGKGDVQSLSEDASSASSDKQKKQETATKLVQQVAQACLSSGHFEHDVIVRSCSHVYRFEFLVQTIVGIA